MSISAAILAYTYVGYPFLIAALARLFPLSVHRDEGYTPTVSAIIPVYNAKTYVAAKLQSLLELDYPPEKLEIIVSSDASDDGTDEVIRDVAARHPRIRFFRAEARKGKPAGVNRMVAEAKGDVLLMTDIRQPLDRACLRQLTTPLADPRVAAVSGNLCLTGGTGAGFYWRYENWIRKNEGRFRSMVGVTGPIYVVRRNDMGVVPGDVILDDMWVPMRLRLQRRLVLFAEKAIAMDDAFGDEREFGRKVRTLAGNYQLFTLMPQLLVPGMNPSFFEVFSHKLLRLVCPWALLALLLATLQPLIFSDAYPPGQLTMFRFLGLGQAMFYFAAALGKRAGKLGTIARTFVIMNAAAVMGLWRFVSGQQKVTW